jgi:hypothetical protein
VGAATASEKIWWLHATFVASELRFLSLYRGLELGVVAKAQLQLREVLGLFSSPIYKLSQLITCTFFDWKRVSTLFSD